MKGFVTWTSAALILGGLLAAMVGLLWYRGGNLLGFFGVEVRPDRGLGLALAGLAAVLAGFGLFRLMD